MMDLLSLLISAVALLIALFTYFAGRKRAFKENQLTDREIEFVRLQIDKEYRERRAAGRSDIHANIVKLGKTNWKLRVGNSGPGDAFNVELVLDEQNKFIQASSIFPMEKMAKGQSVDVPAHVHLQTKPKENLRLRWENADGATQEKKLVMTI